MNRYNTRRAMRAAIVTGLCLTFASTSLAAEVHHIRIDGVINPVSSRFITDAVSRAEAASAEALVIELDTPGGLLESTRDIVQSFLAAKVPIVVYVAPSGARAGSAGVFITLAAHVAAMAPGTNIGAAHPVNIGGGMPGTGQPDSASQSVMGDKMTNDAAAMIRAIAEQRKRNVDWAELAVRKSDAITASDALEKGVIDIIAPSLDSLLFELDGRKVSLPNAEHILKTRDASVNRFEMSWRQRVLDKISDPNIAYILMMLGIYGLIFELSNPGSILPGVLGGICILLAFLAFQTLPVSTVGLLLILFGIILLLLEIKVPSYGILTIGGTSSLLLGSLMLIKTEAIGIRISLGVIVPSVLFLVAFTLFAVGMALRAQKRRITTGSEGLLGQVGQALTELNPKGQILIEGEYWMAEAVEPPVKVDEAVLVVEVQGMVLRVKRHTRGT